MTGARLVVCADDAGLATSTDDAILRCCADGIVRSVSVVAGGPTAEDFLARAGDVEIGLHINLTEGTALAGPAPTLTEAGGRFVGHKEGFWLRAPGLDRDEVAREVTAQWQWLRARARIAHVNGHNHVHVFGAVRAALPPDCRARVPADPGLPESIVSRAVDPPCHFTGHEFCAEPTEEVFLRCVRAPVTEFMVHPGSRPGTAFTEAPERDRETDVLCSVTLRDALAAGGVDVVRFGELA